MPIPNADTAFIPAEKLTRYLLDIHHPIGGSKAKWFRSLGYDLADPVALERDLLRSPKKAMPMARSTSSQVQYHRRRERLRT